MANTFLAAQGYDVGKSLQEPDLHQTALKILAEAKAKGCEIVLPIDLVVSEKFAANPPTLTVPADAVPQGMMALDVGPATVEAFIKRLPEIKTIIWNGPLGAFEITPFDAATNALAQAVADATAKIRADFGWWRRRYCIGAAGSRGCRTADLYFERRWRISGMDGRQNAAWRGSTGGRRPNKPATESRHYDGGRYANKCGNSLT